ncbi:unnamed protein product [Paramecium primaurelia]|uniref:Uncharacterized protein n=1 Tax=Paramecium primaurelia TaxID=5886 RepID=A0A8S1M691_PARPR|nr:unnamed protein product [Paramecium primaurelia]
MKIKNNIRQYYIVVQTQLNFQFCAFYSTFRCESDLPISTIIGSDQFIIFFVFSYTLYKSHSSLWRQERLFLQFITLYSINMYISRFFNIGTEVILLVIYFANQIFIFNNENLKSKIMEQFGLSAEEEYYSFDEHLTYVKRRIFILIQKITIISKQMTLFQQNNNQYQQHQQQKQEQDDGKKKLSLLKGGLNKFYLFIPPHRIYHIIPTPENDAHYVNFILGLLMSIARVTGLQFQLIDEFTKSQKELELMFNF